MPLIGTTVSRCGLTPTAQKCCYEEHCCKFAESIMIYRGQKELIGKSYLSIDRPVSEDNTQVLMLIGGREK